MPGVGAGRRSRRHIPCYTTVGIRQHADGTLAEGAAEEIIELGKAADAVAIGPGLGRSPAVVAFVRRVLEALREVPVVLDADGLFAVSPFTDEFREPDRAAGADAAPRRVRATDRRTCSEGLTPNGQEQAVAFAQRFGHVLLLKGSGTLVSDGQRLYRNTTGNPGMATGGSGDVLSGVIAALLGQGLVGVRRGGAGCVGPRSSGRPCGVEAWADGADSDRSS